MFFLLTARDVTNLELAVRILSAVLIGGAIGLEREYKNRPAGMRTHALVSLGAATIAILESVLLRNMLAVFSIDNVALSLGRLSAQVISGIGFLGAGTIFVTQKKIAGLTTAASVWVVACIGLLCGFGFYLFGAFNGLVVMGVLFLQRVIHVNASKKVEIRFLHRSETMVFLNEYFEKRGIRVLDIDFHVEVQSTADSSDRNLYINLYTLHLPRRVVYSEIVNDLSQYRNIQMVRTRTM